MTRLAWLWGVLALAGCTGEPPQVVTSPLSLGEPWRLDGAGGEGLGEVLAGAGDIDGDGFDDLLVGLPGHGGLFAGEGRVALIRGGAKGLTVSPWSVTGGQRDAHLGTVVAAVGDVDGDGFADVAIGAPDFDALAADDGAVWVYFGGRGGFARAPWFNQGRVAGARFGAAIVGGDIDGDGFSELVVGAPGDSGGRVVVFRGTAVGPEATPREVMLGAAGEALGQRLAAAGDVDADGYADVLVAAPGRGAGWVGLVRGQADGRLAGVASWSFEATAGDAPVGFRGVGDVDGDGFADVAIGLPEHADGGGLALYFGAADGALVTGPFEVGTALGVVGLGRVVSAVEVNGDGLADVVVSAQVDGRSDAALVVFAGGPRDGVRPWRVTRCPDCDVDIGFGRALAQGDFNGDGFGDVAIGSPGWNAGASVSAAAGAGRVEVQLGHAGPPGASPVFEVAFDAQVPGDGQVAFVGDGNNDGFGDVVTCSPSADGGRGGCIQWRGAVGGFGAYVTALTYWGLGSGRSVSGGTDIDNDGNAEVLVGLVDAAVLSTLTWQGPTPPHRTLAGTAGEAAGVAVSIDGDTNGDGVADLLVGAPRAGTSLDLAAPGEVQLTRPRRVPATTFNPPSVTYPDAPDWRARGAFANAGFGEVVAYAGDLDGDARAEIVVGLPNEERVRVYRSTDAGPSALDDLRGAPDQHFGAAVAAAGDIDGDGLGDLLVGAPAEGDQPGRVLVYFGDRARGLRPGATVLTRAAADGEADLGGDRFGAAVASAGDVDGDGFADIIVGAPGAGVGGRAYVFRGSADGLVSAAFWRYDGAAGEAVGTRVAGGGDIDGDGFGDVAVVSRERARVFRGNGATTPLQGHTAGLTNTGSPSLIHPWSAGQSPISAAVQLRSASPAGRCGTRVEWELKRYDVPFDALTALARSDWHEETGTRDILRVATEALRADSAYHWRARVLLRPSDAPLQGRLPWVWGGTSGQPHAVHMRTRTNAAPRAGDDSFVCTRDEVCVRAGLLVNDVDDDGDTLATVSEALASDAGGQVELGASGGFRYTPEPGFVGFDRFRYQAVDGGGGVATSRVTLRVLVPGCDASDIVACGEGSWSGTLPGAAAEGATAGFACRVILRAGARQLVCDTDARGDLLMSGPLCGE